MSTATTEFEIRLNGESFRVAAGSSLADLVRELGLAADRVAAELDGSVVRRGEWPERRLEAGSAVEIVQIVGGG